MRKNKILSLYYRLCSEWLSQMLRSFATALLFLLKGKVRREETNFADGV